MRQIKGPLVLLSWLYERAGHWVLDRLGIQGQLLPTELSEVEDDSDADDAEEVSASAMLERPSRPIHSIDLRVAAKPDSFIQELRRLADWYHSQETVEADLTSHSRPKAAQPMTLASLFTDDVETNEDMSLATSRLDANDMIASDNHMSLGNLLRVDEHPTRRWYPVIDFSRCTNCMECIDFCLFGVYGVDASERILVEQPDNCRKGCPACSRVCPANAIMFPQHKTPAIAGAPAGDSSFKIDLSKLFGAPENDEDAAAVAARERDEHLILAGRLLLDCQRRTMHQPE